MVCCRFDSSPVPRMVAPIRSKPSGNESWMSTQIRGRTLSLSNETEYSMVSPTNARFRLIERVWLTERKAKRYQIRAAMASTSTSEPTTSSNPSLANRPMNIIKPLKNTQKSLSMSVG